MMRHVKKSIRDACTPHTFSYFVYHIHCLFMLIFLSYPYMVLYYYLLGSPLGTQVYSHPVSLLILIICIDYFDLSISPLVIRYSIMFSCELSHMLSLRKILE